MSEEKKRVEDSVEFYLEKQLDFDKTLIGLRYRTIKKHIKGPYGLELGPAEGQMTRYLVDDFEELTIVDGASDLLALVHDAPNVIKVHALFEEFEPEKKYNTILMEHILEHVDDPVGLMVRAKEWLADDGVMLLGVPNGMSLHRLAAVKMGLLSHSCELNSRDHELGHRRVYTPETFRADVEKAGLKIAESGGVFIKPVSNKQIQDNWNENMIEGFYQLGNDFPENSAEIYVVATK